MDWRVRTDDDRRPGEAWLAYGVEDGNVVATVLYYGGGKFAGRVFADAGYPSAYGTTRQSKEVSSLSEGQAWCESFLTGASR